MSGARSTFLLRKGPLTACAGALLIVAACTGPAPRVRTQASTPPTRPTAPAARHDAPRTAPIVLPARVAVELSSVGGDRAVEVTDGAGTTRRLSAVRSGVALGGGAPRPEIRVQGPVQVDGARHPGDARITVDRKGGLRTIVDLDLEDYVAAVVAAELPIWSAEPAELEAQAIAARTFAVQGMRTRRIAGEELVLTDGVLDQAYHGSYDGSGSAGAARAKERLESAVRATRGLVLMRGDGLEEARYHASCGRHTASFSDVFADEVREHGAAGPIGVRCPSCAARAAAEAAAGAPDADRPLGWIARLDAEDLARAGRGLNLGGPLTRLAPARVDRDGRWIEVHVAGPTGPLRIETFDDLRAAIGYGVLKGSAIVTTLPRPGRPIGASGLKVQGRGRGHGVGLCQEALRDLARQGWTSERILRHYYPGARIERLPAARD